MLKRTRFVALGFVAFLAVSKDASAECVQKATIENSTSGTRDFSLACGTGAPSNFSLEPNESHDYTCKWSRACGDDTGIYISFVSSPRVRVQRRELYNGMSYHFGMIGNDIALFMAVF
ncbi:hypothetical protein [Polyangium mundeleinium]|uniref:Uncharacterized protein n=1 Tax=Polyangium mundeleinium TaxID=2995306 RepID=A0ABT5EW59_9BACT|nr:hypothetical protein [Polyangium mundeleinium]MDC0745443.1 hypothetical protein [Polyangium mundeleinium]